MVRRIADLGEDVLRQLMERCSKFIEFSLALDESTDITDVAQLAIFVRGVDSDLVVTQELLDVIPLKDTTTGEDIFQAVEDACDAVGLPWERLYSLTTDGASSMRGSKVGFTTSFQEKLKNLNVKLYTVHCIIH